MRAPDFTEANCRDMGTELFFPDSREQEIAVKPFLIKMCANCPIYKSCLEYSLHVKVEGIWAGTTANERRIIRKRRGIEGIGIASQYTTDIMLNQSPDARHARKARQRKKEREQENA
jgi:hypothetical protein